MKEYLDAGRNMGALHAGIRVPSCGLFLNGVRAARSCVYSGDDGVLAGDHIKSASDLDIHS